MLMNKILRYSFVALLAMMFGNVMADDYELYSGAITEGDYVIYYSGKALKNTVASNRLEYSEVTPAGDVISNPDAAIVWKIAKSGDYYTLYNAAVKKYAGATGSKNQAALLDDATDDKALWSITGSDTYDFENKARAAATKDSNNKWLRNNSTYGFACYASSTGGALSLYKKSDGSDTRTATTIEFADGYEQWFAPSGPFDETYPVAAATVKANGTPIDAIVTWTVEKKDDWAAYEGEGELTVVEGKVSGIHKKSFGTLTLTASFAGDQTAKPSTKSYDIKVCKIPNRIQDFYEWYGNKKENIAKGMPVCYFLIDLDENDTPTPRQELVTYVKGANTYITDGKQGLLLYKSNLGLAVGDKITVAGATKADPIWGTLKSFNGTIEIEVDHMGVVKSSTGNEVTPIEITVDKITALDNFFTNWQGGHMTPLNENVFLSNYVTIKDAEYVGTSGSNEQFKVGDATFLVYKNGANVTFEATAKYTLTGVGSSYNKSGDITPQLNYISSEMTAPASVNAIKSNAQFSGKMYNMAGQVVNKGYKGLVIQDGRKFVNK